MGETKFNPTYKLLFSSVLNFPLTKCTQIINDDPIYLVLDGMRYLFILHYPGIGRQIKYNIFLKGTWRLARLIQKCITQKYSNI